MTGVPILYVAGRFQTPAHSLVTPWHQAAKGDVTLIV
jgi:hypothetical protein